MIYPPTKGLLVSMANRHTHDFGMPHHVFAPGISQGLSDFEREGVIVQMHDLYLRLTAKDAPPPASITESQIFEEVTGDGFYCPDREMFYAAKWPKDYVPACFVPAEFVPPAQS